MPRRIEEEELGWLGEHDIRLGPWLIWIYMLALIGLGISKVEVLAVSSWTALLMMFATWITWCRLPKWLQELLTIPVVALVLDIFVAFVGWFILPNSTHVKIAFIMFHIAISFALFWEHDRLRGKVEWPWVTVARKVRNLFTPGTGNQN